MLGLVRGDRACTGQPFFDQLLHYARIEVDVELHPGRELGSDAALCTRTFNKWVEPGRAMPLC